MSDKKIIFFDIDGTLLDDDKKMPLTAEKAVFALKELGHEVAIATGRAPFMFKDIREQLEIDSYVSFNGQYVVLHGEVVATNPLNREALQAMTDLALTHNHALVYMDHMDMKANIPNDELVEKSVQTLKAKISVGYDPLYFQGRDIYQTLLMCTAEEEPFYETVFKAFDFVRWHPSSVDVVPHAGSKAKGIREITSRLGIAAENQYAFGDGLNDVEMLTAIHNSVAMGNGCDEAKAVAKMVTKRADEDGILYGLQKLGLLS
ncbi:Cof-type HAD-IIB family hydrolase [Paenibacillus polymyxa]|uniref:Cof-type HAD-IIB family hydrolase n=1 Tax=Paenibacillus polymyxa TaxID=1406 RepID=UPI00287F42D0|nr:Cof-type HAD-IIB family hydrolase [Paenibacillus polymyxa]